jgi:SAM-dependent methyltransferase
MGVAHMRVVLNLGAGNAPLGDGAINHDVRKHRPEIDVVHDLNVRPWPWKDTSIDFIYAKSVFEHLSIDLVQALDECWRMLRPGGRVALKLPHWKSDVAWWDVTHRWKYSLKSFDQFDPDTARGQDYGFYTDRKWRIVDPAKLNKAESSIHVVLEVRK